MADLVTALLRVLNRSVDAQFNVFDVMHHGTHEKQLSNVFGWLLNAQGTHRLDDGFLRIFIEEVNRSRPWEQRLPETDYLVLQEVNTAGPEELSQDIADLVLVHDEAVIVVENYYTSDGHGHSYDRYLEYSKRGDRPMGAVVLLCEDHDGSRQNDGWEEAAVVTYGRLLDRLWSTVHRDRRYALKNPEPYSFIDQMHRKFVEGRGPVEDQEVLDFLVAMCTTGEAGRYAEQKHGSAAERFANDVAVQARERFAEGRETLMRIKQRLTTYGNEHLKKQLNASLGEGFVGAVSARYVGNYWWTVNFEVPGLEVPDDANFGESHLQLKFGPSAWFANERDPNWTVKVDPTVADYSRLFITSAKTREIRQSAVTLDEVLGGLAADDLRLRDEIVAVVREAG